MQKTIHCVWLGGQKTKLAHRCRASWTRFASEWIVKEWGLEKRDDVWRLTVNGDDAGPIRLPQYVKDALACRKWAFAADWLRFFVLMREGGVYFDYDLELIRSLESLPSGEWVAGEWIRNETVTGMNPCAIALEYGSSVAERMLLYYETVNFTIEKTVGDLMAETGITITVLPPEIFCPSDHRGQLHVTERTLGIHRYALSWITARRRVARWLNWHGFGWLTEMGLMIKRIFRR